MQKPCAVNACCFKHVFNNQENKIQNQYMKEIINKSFNRKQTTQNYSK